MRDTATSELTGLVHHEADIKPGTLPQATKVDRTGRLIGEGGFAALRLYNDSDVERSYEISVRPGSAEYWREDWVRVVGLNEATLNGNRADGYSQDGQSVQVFLAPGATRFVAALFNLPESPEARAGLYGLKFVVEDSLAGKDGQKVREYSFIAIVRPVYDWSLEIKPDKRILKYFRRRRKADLLIRNRSNDWLYLELNSSTTADLDVDAPVSRVAIPPPERSKPDRERSVPLRFYSNIRTIRDVPLDVAINVTSERIDAPGVPQLPKDDTGGMSGANLSAPVISRPGKESPRRAEPAKLTYYPPIPKRWTDAWTSVKSGFLGLAGLVAVVLMVMMAVSLAFQHFQYDAKAIWSQEPNAVIMPGEKISISGKLVPYSKFRVSTSSGQTLQDWEPGPIDPRKTGMAQQWQTTVKSTWPAGIVLVEVKPMAQLPLLGSAIPLWGKDFSRPFEIKPAVAMPVAVISPDDSNEDPGQLGILRGQNLTPKGSLTYRLKSGGEDKPIDFLRWGESEIQLKIPNLPYETGFIVTATRDDQKSVSWTLRIKKDPALPANPEEGRIDVPAVGGAQLDPSTDGKESNGNPDGGSHSVVPTPPGGGASTAALADAIAVDTETPALSAEAKAQYKAAAQAASDPAVAAALNGLVNGSMADIDRAASQASTDQSRATVALLRGRLFESQGKDGEADGQYANRDINNVVPVLASLFEARFLGTGQQPDKQAARARLSKAESLGGPEVKKAADKLRTALKL